MRDRLVELGLDASADVFGVRDPRARDFAQRAAALADVARIRQSYRRTIADLERSERALADLPREQAMAESFVLGGRAIRQLVLDPRLPDALMPAAERRALIDTRCCATTAPAAPLGELPARDGCGRRRRRTCASPATTCPPAKNFRELCDGPAHECRRGPVADAGPALAGQERWLDEADARRDPGADHAPRHVSWLSIAINWGTIFGSMALVAAWPNPLTIALALLLIGTRQLGMAILMHDAAHRAPFLEPHAQRLGPATGCARTPSGPTSSPTGRTT
ncbi:MAG: hypothetical protein U1E86_28395 [Burkholderiaceae bacterium]